MPETAQLETPVASSAPPAEDQLEDGERDATGEADLIVEDVSIDGMCGVY